MVMLCITWLLTASFSSAQILDDLIVEEIEPVYIQPVNRILGDISYQEKYGELPKENTSEKLRIQTHLEFVEQELRTAHVFNLDEQQLKNRYKVLDILNTYWRAGEFPTNYYYHTRTPVFKDKDGNLCAVAYLIQQTAGDDVVNRINRTHKFHYVESMTEDYILDWMETYGLTVEECAMIQPTYNHHREQKIIKPPCVDTFPKSVVLYEIYQVDSAAHFIGGDKAFLDFMQQHRKYPQLAKEHGIEGTVYLSFIIAPNGVVCNITIPRGVSPVLDEEAKRLIRLTSGHWQPAKVKNKAVYSNYTVPVNFRLDR
jgi:TonB family protein